MPQSLQPRPVEPAQVGAMAAEFAPPTRDMHSNRRAENLDACWRRLGAACAHRLIPGLQAHVPEFTRRTVQAASQTRTATRPRSQASTAGPLG